MTNRAWAVVLLGLAACEEAPSAEDETGEHSADSGSDTSGESTSTGDGVEAAWELP